jgi:hypothetical protein
MKTGTIVAPSNTLLRTQRTTNTTFATTTSAVVVWAMRFHTALRELAVSATLTI